MPTINSRIKRTLQSLRSFKILEESSSIPENLPVGDQEIPLGIYYNHQSALKECVVITNRSLILERSGTWLPVPYASIIRVSGPADKVNTGKLKLSLDDGTTIPLMITGGRGKFSDSFEFLRFLDRVLGDIRA